MNGAKGVKNKNKELKMKCVTELRCISVRHEESIKAGTFVYALPELNKHVTKWFGTVWEAVKNSKRKQENAKKKENQNNSEEDNQNNEQ